MKTLIERFMAWLGKVLSWEARETAVKLPDSTTLPPEPPPAPLPQPEPVKPPKIHRFCEGIGRFEGFYQEGAAAKKNKNPGNLRWTYGKPYPYGAIGLSPARFLIFATNEEGWAALRTYVTNCASGKAKNKAFYPSMTIVQFFRVYAPAEDSNDPDHYAKWVAAFVGVGPDYQIKNLL